MRRVLVVCVVLAAQLSIVARATPAHASATPVISIGDARIAEGDAKVRSVQFAVTLSVPSATPVTVSYVIAPIDATPGLSTTSGADFNNRGGVTRTLTWNPVNPPNVTKYVSVQLFPDTVPESNEQFTVTLSNPSSGYTIGDGVGIATIVDDDVDGSNRITVSDTSIHEGDAIKRAANFHVVLSQPATSTVTVDYRIVPITASGGYKSGILQPGNELRDYLGQTKTLKFVPGPSGFTPVLKTIAVLTYPDMTAEGDETFEIRLTNLQGPAVLADDTGVGTIIDDGDTNVPVAWTTVSAGGAGAGIKTDGTLWTWGLNATGLVGDGTLIDRFTPTQVGTATNWASVSTGELASLALKTDGTLWSWGNNQSGTLGNGTTNGPDCGGFCRATPGQVGVDTDWASVSTAFGDVAAIKTNGTLWTWGFNGAGQLGTGRGFPICAGFGSECRTTPAQVGTDTDWANVSAGAGHTVAIKTDGTLWSWGSNAYGQLGLAFINGPECNNDCISTPTQVGSDSDWARAIAGESFTVALKTDGTVWAFGDNSKGQLGNGTTAGPDCSGTCEPTPAQIGAATNWATISAGGASTLATKSDGTLWGFGDNTKGQLGDGTQVTRLAPTQIFAMSIWSAASVGKTSGSLYSLVLRSDGTLWGSGTARFLAQGSSRGTACQPRDCHLIHRQIPA